MVIFAFSWAGMSGERKVQSRRRLLARLALISTKVSSQRLLSTRQRNSSIPSAFSSYQLMLLPLSRKLITRRMALSMAPLPKGTPRRRKRA